MTNLDLEMKIKKVLREKGMTQSKLAESLGIKPAYCSDIIRGNRNGGKTKQKMLKFLGIKDV